MTRPNERIRITAHESDVMIRIDGETEEVLFDLTAGTRDDDGAFPAELLGLRPSARPDEFVLTLEFEGGEPVAEVRVTTLRRLDVHIRDVSLRLRHTGYVLEGTLAGWIGYTNAFPS
ncbi:MAG: hypothetical protein ACOC2V_04270 [Alkalispirochaeta sp.]